MQQTKEELYELCKDRTTRKNMTYPNNSWYGIHDSLVSFAGFPEAYEIKAAVQHGGPFLWNHVYKPDIFTPFPSLLKYSTYTNTWLRQRTQKAIFSIGNPIAYASSILCDREISLERNRLGKSLLVFPKHSTHHFKATYEVQEYCQYLQSFRHRFNSIRVCLYWKDILNGLAPQFESFGFEVVTAGHMYDPMFMPRLKSLILVSDAVTMNSITSGLGYAVFFDKPVLVTNTLTLSYENASNCNSLMKEVLDPDAFLAKPEISELCNAFSEDSFVLTEKQKLLVDKYWGNDIVLTAVDLRQILEAMEQMYQTNQKLFLHNESATVAYAIACIEQGKFRLASKLIKYELTCKDFDEDLVHAYIVCLLKLNEMEKARKFLRKTVLDNPQSLKLLALGCQIENM